MRKIETKVVCGAVIPFAWFRSLSKIVERMNEDLPFPRPYKMRKHSINSVVRAKIESHVGVEFDSYRANYGEGWAPHCTALIGELFTLEKLESAREKSRVVDDRGDKMKVDVYLDYDIHRKLSSFAKFAGLPVGKMIERLVENDLDTPIAKDVYARVPK